MNEPEIKEALLNVGQMILQDRMEEAEARYQSIYPTYSLFKYPELYRNQDIEHLYDVIDSMIRLRHLHRQPYTKHNLAELIQKVTKTV